MAPRVDDARNGPTGTESLRRRERLDLLARVGFWVTAGSVVVLTPACLGFSFFMPSWIGPWTFLPAPLVFLAGGLLFIGAQVLVDRTSDCPTCAAWIEDGFDPAGLQRCPTCGRWGRPGAPAGDANPTGGPSGFPVVLSEHRGAAANSDELDSGSNEGAADVRTRDT